MSSQQYLSKSLYTKGVQCHKALWMLKYRPELQDEVPDSLQDRFDVGTDIGFLAQQIFSGGVEVPYEGLSHQEQLDRTAQLLADGMQTIYEATFSFDNTFCKVDILHLADDGWELYEVKNSTGQKEIYLHDIAVQYHILSGSGYRPVRAFLVHINNQYVRNGEINVHELFTVCDLTDEVLGLQEEVQTRLAAQRSMLDGDLRGRRCWLRCQDKIMSVKPLSAAGGSQDRGPGSLMRFLSQEVPGQLGTADPEDIRD
jgi:hypothetical protein